MMCLPVVMDAGAQTGTLDAASLPRMRCSPPPFQSQGWVPPSAVSAGAHVATDGAPEGASHGSLSCEEGGSLRLRGGAGGGLRTYIDGQTRKGIWMGLKRSADGSHIIREDVRTAAKKLRDGPTAEEAAQAAQEEEARSAEALACHRVAGGVAGEALRHLVSLCVVGANASQLCLEGDRFVRAEMVRRFPGKVGTPCSRRRPKHQV